MTVSVEVVKVGPTEGNGVTTAFPFNFKTFAEADVVVTHTDQYGVETTLVLDADYSVALNPDQNAAPGGTVTYPIVVGIPPVYLPPMTAGNFLTLENGVDFTQPTDLITGGQYQPQTVEEMGDRMTLLATRLHAMWLSSFRLSPGDTLGGSAILPNSSVRANRVLGFDASGNLETKFTLGALTDADVAAIIESYTMAMVNKTFDDFSNTIHADALHLQVRNSSGSLIPKGSVVYTTGATGSLPTIDLADASTEATSSTTLGIVTADIANNGIGQIITKGFVTGLDTSGFTEGAVVWLSPTAGQFTETKPVSPDHLTMVGLIIRAHPTDGYMYIGIINYNELGELHDVLITSIGDKELLQWDAATSLYTNRTRAEAGIAARGSLSLSLTGGTRVLTAAEFECSSIDVTGALASAQIIQVPNGIPQIFVVDNGTSGAYTLTVKHSATAGVVIPQGSKYLIYTNGAQVEVIEVATAGSSMPVIPYSTSHTVLASEIGTMLDCTNTITITLLAPATAGNGATLAVRNSGTGLVTLTDGASFTEGIPPGSTVYLTCDGSAYEVVSQSPRTPTIHVRDEQTSGTDGGGSSVGWNTRAFNTVVENSIPGASLATNQVTLPAGRYRVRHASAPAFRSAAHKLRLYNVTDTLTEAVGQSAWNNAAGAYAQTVAMLHDGEFVLAASKVLELQHYIGAAQPTNGLGLATSSGEVEVYAEMIIEKVG